MGKAKPKLCEICGAPIRGPGHKIRIEGAELLVCDRCYDRYSHKKPGTFSTMPTGRRPLKRAYTSSRPKPRTAGRPRTERPLYSEEIVEDFADRVYRAIQKTGKSYEELSHEIGLSMNDLRAIAHGYREPTIKEAKKLERYFKITLIERTGQEVQEKATVPKDYEPTLGDIANIKVKKRKKK